MSIESAKAFCERVKNDEDFKKEMISEVRASVEERMKFAKAQGFDFTIDEVNQARDSLSEEELDEVAGGYGRDGSKCSWGDSQRLCTF